MWNAASNLYWSIVSDKLRVAFDVSSMRGRKTGIGVYTEQLLRALNAYAPQIEIARIDDDAPVEQRTDRRIWREQVTLPRHAQRARADILHLTGFAAPLVSRTPVVLTVMDLIGVLFAENFPPASRFYWSKYLPFTLRAARHIITLSEHTKRDVLRLTRVPAERVTVLPPGLDARFHVLDDAAALQDARARLALPEHFFLCVSTLEPRKGIDTLINAYAKIVAQVDEQLVIVGKRGWYFETLFARVRALQLETRVHLTAYVADGDMTALYNRATAFVFPSRYEGFGYPPLEAMACGAPVISSNAASLPEVVGDAGMLCAPNDTECFARAMVEVATNESLRNKLRAQGLQRAKMFSWERAVNELVQCYESLVSSLQSPISNLVHENHT